MDSAGASILTRWRHGKNSSLGPLTFGTFSTSAPTNLPQELSCSLKFTDDSILASLTFKWYKPQRRDAKFNNYRWKRTRILRKSCASEGDKGASAQFVLLIITRIWKIIPHTFNEGEIYAPGGGTNDSYV